MENKRRHQESRGIRSLVAPQARADHQKTKRKARRPTGKKIAGNMREDIRRVKGHSREDQKIQR